MTLPALPPEHSTAWYAHYAAIDKQTRGANQRAAIAAGKRLRATTAGDQSVTNPDVTVGTLGTYATASAITSPVARYAWTGSQIHPAMRVTRGKAVQDGANSWIRTDTSVITYAPGTLDVTALQLDTAYSGQKIDVILFNGGSGTNRILVDSVLVATVTAAQLTAAGVSVGSWGRLGLAFTDARRRIITFQALASDGKFVGYEIEPAQAIAYPATEPKGPRVILAGDSFTEGTGITAAGFGFPEWVSFHMGWGDLWRSGTGSTGYYENGTRTNLVGRYQNDIINQNPDIVIIAMGINDLTAYLANPANVTGAATTVWDAITTQKPKVELIVVGPWPSGGGVGVSAGLIAMDTALHDLAVARSLRYISPIAEGWTFSLSDATHPDDAGHETLGWRLAGHLAVPYLEGV